MDVRFALKVGVTSVEFEGASEMFLEQISPIVERLLVRAESEPTLSTSNGSGSVTAGMEVAKASSSGVPIMTTKSVATKLNANSGTSLLYAAIASLAVVQQKDTFTRHDLNTAMKSAVGYYRPTYTNNLTNYIDTLLKQGVMIEVAKDTYALRESERSAMEQKLS